MPKVALGKGLGALINTRIASPTPAVELGERIQNVSLDDIVPTPLQPRSAFHDDQLRELVESVRQRGIIQPLIVRLRDGRYELIAGERRWRAAREVGLKQAPVILREASDQEVLELALVENLQRADLNPIEEASAFARLAREFGLKQEEIAAKVGKSRAAVANTMRLLDLHPQVQSWVASGKISVGHAKVLLGLKSQAEQLLLAEYVLRHNCTVRATEKLLASRFTERGETKPGRRTLPTATRLGPALQHVQNRLQQHLGTHVTLHHGEKRGHIEIEYYGNDDLNRLLTLLGLPPEEV